MERDNIRLLQEIADTQSADPAGLRGASPGISPNGKGSMPGYGSEVGGPDRHEGSAVASHQRALAQLDLHVLPLLPSGEHASTEVRDVIGYR